MAILFILLPKVVYLPHDTMEFFDFTRGLKVNEYNQLKPGKCGKVKIQGILLEIHQGCKRS